jgi:heme A synthase
MSTLLIALISFNADKTISMGRTESWYWVPYNVSPIQPTTQQSPIIINLVQRTAVGITFIAWIISLIMILKTKDKEKKERRIKISIIVMSVLIILTIACFVIVRSLNR